MSARADLLDLTTDALTALANPGFVKRARKDLDAGRGPILDIGDDGAVTARFDDGVVTTLPVGTAVRDAACSCPASGWCRHRVMLVLAYQDGHHDAPKETKGHWSPAEFTDESLTQALAPATLAAARRMARGTVRLSAPDGIPTARLPLNTVQFFSPSALAHARCDCRDVSGCAHLAVAVWAFRAAGDAGSTMAREMVVSLGSDTDRRPEVDGFAADLDALIVSLWSDGTSSEDAGLDARLGALTEQARRAGWSWVAADLEELCRQREALHQRRTDADPEALLTLVAEAPARLRAAAAAGELDAPQRTAGEILGVGVPGETELAHLRLISLGAESWRDEHGVGARVYLADPDTGSVSVLERRWSGLQPAAERRILGTRLQRVAQGQVVTTGARRRALGLIEISAERGRTSLHDLSPAAWDAGTLPHGIGHESWPAFVCPRRLGDGIRVLTVDAVHDWGFDAAAQQLVADVTGPDGDTRLVLGHSAAAPGAVDALADVLEAGNLHRVSVRVHRRAGRLICEPLAVLTQDRALVLATEAASGRELPPAPPDAPAGPLERARLELAGWLRRGLRHQSRAARERLAGLAEGLSAAGMTVAGTELATAAAAIGEDADGAVRSLQRVVLLLSEISAPAD
ncbi:SWIM zinc finger family protein [Mycobacterium sp. NPDC004974]